MFLDTAIKPANSFIFFDIRANRRLQNEVEELYNFLLRNDLKRVVFSIVLSSNSSVYTLGVINPKKIYVTELLKEVAICFSMSVYDKNKISETKKIALYDALTGVANRAAYNKDIKYAKTIDFGNYACIYVDVNELHTYNNNYGHRAGDVMLMRIAAVLKNVFSNGKVYRTGGDEFLILIKNAEFDAVCQQKEKSKAQIEAMGYCISVGIEFGCDADKIEETVSYAEKLMYEDKSKYYQEKSVLKSTTLSEKTTSVLETDIDELDTFLNIINEKYVGVHCVSLSNDSIVSIISPSYFNKIVEENAEFSTAMKRYISEFVMPEYHRQFVRFLDYNVLKKSLENGQIPRMNYQKVNLEKVTLSIYPVRGDNDDFSKTIWVFENEN